MCLATMKLEEGKRKSASMAMINANVAAVIAEILEKYRNQIVKEVNALIIDILDTFVQAPTTSDGKTSNQNRSMGGASAKTKSSSSFLKTAMASAGIGTHTDPNSDFNRLNDNACVVEVTVESDESETVWLGDDGFPNINLNDEGGDPSRNAEAYQKITPGNIAELVWLDDNGKPVMLNEPLSDAFAAPLDHTYQFFENVVEQTVHDSTDTKTTLDATKRKVQRRRSKSASRDDGTVTTETPEGPSRGRTKRAPRTPRTTSKSPAGERSTDLSLQTAPFKCDQCNKQYKYKCDLKFHQLSHNGAKLFHCSVCGKSFNHPANKRNHERLHDPNGRFECGVCGHMYTQKGNLKYHIMKMHGDKKQKRPRFRCEFCGNRYFQNRSYKRHVPKCTKRDVLLIIPDKPSPKTEKQACKDPLTT